MQSSTTKKTPHKKPPEEEVEKGFLWRIGWTLTTVSMLWSLYSVQDLMDPAAPNAGGLWTIYAPGLVVGLAAEAFWGVIQYLNHRKVKIGHPRLVPVLGWISVASMMGLLVWHGADQRNFALAVAGPLVPLVAKLAWVGWDALNVSPSALTPEQQAALDEMEREGKFKEKQDEADLQQEMRDHQAELARIRMQGEITLEKDDVDFRIERARQDKAKELYRQSSVLEAPASPQVIRGEVSRPAPKASHSLPAARVRPPGITMDVGDLSEAQRKNKALAVEWYLTHDNDPEMSQAEFARSKGISSGQLSKILAKFPRSEAFEDEQGDQLGA